MGKSINLLVQDSFLEDAQLSPDLWVLRRQLGVLRWQVGPWRGGERAVVRLHRESLRNFVQFYKEIWPEKWF